MDSTVGSTGLAATCAAGFAGVAAGGFLVADLGGVAETAETAGALSVAEVAVLVLRMDCTNFSAVLSVVLMPIPLV